MHEHAQEGVVVHSGTKGGKGPASCSGVSGLARTALLRVCNRHAGYLEELSLM